MRSFPSRVPNPNPEHGTPRRVELIGNVIRKGGRLYTLEDESKTFYHQRLFPHPTQASPPSARDSTICKKNLRILTFPAQTHDTSEYALATAPERNLVVTVPARRRNPAATHGSWPAGWRRGGSQSRGQEQRWVCAQFFQVRVAAIWLTAIRTWESAVGALTRTYTSKYKPDRTTAVPHLTRFPAAGVIFHSGRARRNLNEESPNAIRVVRLLVGMSWRRCNQIGVNVPSRPAKKANQIVPGRESSPTLELLNLGRISESLKFIDSAIPPGGSPARSP